MVAIRDMTVAVDAGEIVVVAGANGAGKSTLLKSIAGMERPRSGAVTFAGERIEGLFAIGPVSRAAFWEITAIPDIREQVAALAVSMGEGCRAREAG